MPNGVQRIALWAMVVLMLATTLTSLSGAQASSPSSYAIIGYVHSGTSIPVPAGVTVDLISGATHQIFTTQTNGSQGKFKFTNANLGGALTPGEWGLWVPAEGNASLGSACTPCAVLPASPQPVYQYESVKELSSQTSVRSIDNVSLLEYNATIYGNVTQGSTKEPGANVQLLDPLYNSLVLYNNTTRSVGNYSLKAPWGTWVVQTTLPGVPTNEFDFQQVTVASSVLHNVNPQISKYLTYGTVYQAGSGSSCTTEEVPYGGNVTLFEPATGYVYSQANPGGGFYLVGTYPHDFNGTASNTFDVVVSNIGYETVWYPLTVSPSNPTGGSNPHNLCAAAQYEPSQFNTTLDYSTGFDWLNVSTQAFLSNDSTFPELPNATVGQLWGQLALDWQHNLTFSGASVPTIENWINSSGPFFPAGAAGAKVNSTGYNETAGGTFSASSTCAASDWCGLDSAASISYSWSKDYQANGTVPTGQKTYTVSFNFRHPDNYQSINYTINLPKGYVLEAGNAVPPGATLVPAGPSGTWTSFILDSQPYSTPSSTATFTFVKYGNITANVNATVSEFAYSKANVLNSTHGNYSVIVGGGQNVTFSAAGTTFPAGTNGTNYAWTWGDGQSTSTANAITYHTYSGGAKEYTGNLTVTSSGGTSATVEFHVYVGSGNPTGVIVSNASAYEKHVGGNNVPYLMVNWSTSLQFNATGFTSSLYSGGPAGVISVASWNATAGTFNQTENLTAASGAYVPGNFTVTFNCGTGSTADTQYLTSANIGGTNEPFLGWQYNITVMVWDGIGTEVTNELIVLVRDTEKPTSVATIQNSGGTNVTSSGIVEGTNHTAEVKLVGSYSSDPNGGSLTWYNWTFTNPGNSSVNMTISIRNATGLRAPADRLLWLDPQTKPYTVNLTVTDRAGNTNYDVASLTIAINTSTRPVLAVGNLTAPTTLTDGDSYTVWANVTNTLGQNSTAQNVSVLFYLLPPSGSGSQIALGGGASNVVFYGYTNGTVNSTEYGKGLVSLKYNITIRAEISFTPTRTGTWSLWVNATASNEFEGDYASGGNEAHVTVSINPNPLTVDLEYGAVAAAVIAILVIAFLVYRRSQNRGRPGGGRSGDRGSSAKKESKPSDADKDDDDE